MLVMIVPKQRGDLFSGGRPVERRLQEKQQNESQRREIATPSFQEARSSAQIQTVVMKIFLGKHFQKLTDLNVQILTKFSKLADCF